MYPQRNPIFTVAPYTVHAGKLSPDDSRDFWIEGPTLTGRMAPIASCWNEGDAIRRAKEMASRTTATAPSEADTDDDEIDHADSEWDDAIDGGGCDQGDDDGLE